MISQNKEVRLLAPSRGWFIAAGLLAFLAVAQPSAADDTAAKDSGDSGKEKASEDQKEKEEPEPDLSWMEEVTLEPRGQSAPPMRPCRLHYELSWRKVISAGEAMIEIKDGAPGVLNGEATAKSTGLARALFTYDCELTAEVDRKTLKPLGFEHTETEKNKKSSYLTEFSPRWVRTYTTELNDKGEEETKRRTVNYGEALDLLSTILYVRSQPLNDGDKVTRVVQPFDRPYLVTFAVEGREKREFDGEDIATIKLSVDIRRVNKDLSLKIYDKMKESSVWLSDDDFRLPIEVRADIFIGYVTCMLENREYTDGKGEEAGKGGAVATKKKPSPAGETGDSPDGKESLADRFRALGEGLRGGGKD